MKKTPLNKNAEYANTHTCMHARTYSLSPPPSLSLPLPLSLVIKAMYCIIKIQIQQTATCFH
jgi:hypothetical protein